VFAGDAPFRLGADTGGVRSANQEDPLPALLTPAQGLSLAIYLDQRKFDEFYALTGIHVEDSTGRKHHLGRRQLRAAKQHVRSSAGACASADPFTIQIGKRPE
jgi:hypothetical protein